MVEVDQCSVDKMHRPELLHSKQVFFNNYRIDQIEVNPLQVRLYEGRAGTAEPFQYFASPYRSFQSMGENVIGTVAVFPEVGAQAMQLRIGMDVKHQVDEVGFTVYLQALEVLLKKGTGAAFLFPDGLGIADEETPEKLADPKGSFHRDARDAIPTHVAARRRDGIPTARRRDGIPATPGIPRREDNILLLHPRQYMKMVGQQAVAIGIQNGRQVREVLPQEIRVIPFLVEQVVAVVAPVEDVEEAAGQERGVVFFVGHGGGVTVLRHIAVIGIRRH